MVVINLSALPFCLAKNVCLSRCMGNKGSRAAPRPDAADPDHSCDACVAVALSPDASVLLYALAGEVSPPAGSLLPAGARRRVTRAARVVARTLGGVHNPVTMERAVGSVRWERAVRDDVHNVTALIVPPAGSYVAVVFNDSRAAGVEFYGLEAGVQLGQACVAKPSRSAPGAMTSVLCCTNRDGSVAAVALASGCRACDVTVICGVGDVAATDGFTFSDGWVHDMALTPDGRYLVLMTSMTAHIFDVGTRHEVGTVTGRTLAIARHAGLIVAMDPDSASATATERAADVVSVGGLCQLDSLHSQRCIAGFASNSIRVSDSGAVIMSGDTDFDAYDAVAGAWLPSVGQLYKPALSPCGEVAVGLNVDAGDTCELHTMRARRRQRLPHLRAQSLTLRPVFSADSAAIAFGTTDGISVVAVPRQPALVLRDAVADACMPECVRNLVGAFGIVGDVPLVAGRD